MEAECDSKHVKEKWNKGEKKTGNDCEGPSKTSFFSPGRNLNMRPGEF